MRCVSRGPSCGRRSRGEPFPEFVELRFLITGAWHAAHAFALESTADLPDGSRLTVQVPEWLGRGLRPERADLDSDNTDLDSDNIVDASTPEGRHRMVCLHLDPHGRHVLGQVDLPSDTTAVSHLRVHIPAEPHERAADIAVRQLYADRKVGAHHLAARPRALTSGQHTPPVSRQGPGPP